MYKITYEDERKIARTIQYDGVNWDADDQEVKNILNSNFNGLIGQTYFKSTWHEAKAVADMFNGTLDAPEPVLKPLPPGAVA